MNRKNHSSTLSYFTMHHKTGIFFYYFFQIGSSKMYTVYTFAWLIALQMAIYYHFKWYIIVWKRRKFTGILFRVALQSDIRCLVWFGSPAHLAFFFIILLLFVCCFHLSYSHFKAFMLWLESLIIFPSLSLFSSCLFVIVIISHLLTQCNLRINRFAAQF